MKHLTGVKAIRAALSAACLAALLALAACSPVKHVPQGQMLLDDVKITVEPNADGKRPEDLQAKELYNYLRQQPNHKVLGSLRLQLATYSLSGHDSTRWYNKWLRRMGQAPVIYSPALTSASASQLKLAMINRGYLDAGVSVDTFARPEKKRIKVEYTLTPGRPRRFGELELDIANPQIRSLVEDYMKKQGLVKSGALFNLDCLDAERTAIASLMRNNGYYAFSKENIHYDADSVAGADRIDVTLGIGQAKGNAATADTTAYERVYRIERVTFVCNYRLGLTPAQAIEEATDSIVRGRTVFLYGDDRWISPKALDDKCFLTPGAIYRASDVDLTYEHLNRLGMLKSVNIEVSPAAETGDNGGIDVMILLTRNKKQAVTFELEGTNSAGDLGVAAGVTYQHRNVGHRSILFSSKLRIGYESLSGNLSGFINKNYQEYSAEAGLTFPRFAIPFISAGYKKKSKASTEVALAFNYQARPEYTRIMAGGAWRYKWLSRSGRTRRTFDLLNINYVYLPQSTNDFLNQIAPDNPLLRYSYEDHFIMNMGFSFYHTSRRNPSAMNRWNSRSGGLQSSFYTLRASAETAGNLLYAISSAVGQHRSGGVYKIFGIQYSQYVKAEAEYSWIRNFTPRHSLGLRAGFGIAIPYGNSTAVPFEKRFYGGGANNVRGWGVRTLGPGAFDGTNSVTDFINQCGDISLILSAEYRVKLFWVIEGGLFIDAGNIWSIRDYENQPGGVFRFSEAWKQLAASYGAGLRFDFTYFLLRLDLGMKAHNPARGREPWPIIHPNWHRDATIHFAVGYPF